MKRSLLFTTLFLAGLLLTPSAQAQLTPRNPLNQNVQPSLASPATASWTSATAADTALTISTANHSSVVLTFRATSTMGTGVVYFEVSDDGTNYYATQCTSRGAFTSAANFTVSTTSSAWQCDVSGFRNFRARLNPQIVGTGTASLSAQASTLPAPQVITVGQAAAGQLNGTVAVTGTATVDSELPAAAAAADGASNPTAPVTQSFASLFNGTGWDRLRGAVNGLNSSGTGIASMAPACQFDDTSPQAVTENNFGNVRCSANRNLFFTLRDAAGNERGANVDANNNLGVKSADSGLTGQGVPATASYSGVMGASGNLVGIQGCTQAPAIYSASTSGSTQIIAASGATVVRICGYSITVGGTATNVKLVRGTGTNCATSPTDITPPYNFAANGGIVDGGPFWRGLAGAAGDAICINASAANPVQALVYWDRQ